MVPQTFSEDGRNTKMDLEIWKRNFGLVNFYVLYYFRGAITIINLID